MIGYTIILVNDLVAILIQNNNSIPWFGQLSIYEGICRLFLGAFALVLLCTYIYTYVLLTRLILMDKESFGFMKVQVHIFFIFLILIQLGRLIVGGIIKHHAQDRILEVDFFDIFLEIIFNCAVLYGFV